MIYASACDGIGAVHVAWKQLGWKCAWTAEIEPYPAAVVEHHYGFDNLGDITEIADDELEARPIDLLVGGTPCQSFSVAGLRAGMADPRGNLALAFLGLADRARPEWVVWENVPGVLSSNEGRDFGTFLGALGELGYGFAYRVLDAQFFGVPQRRRRVFVVGRLGDWRCAAAVLFERQSLSGDSPPGKEAGKDVAGSLAARTRAGGGLGTDFDCAGGVVAQPLLAKANSSHDDSKETYATHSLRAEGFDASEDGTGRGTPLVTAGALRSHPWPGSDTLGALCFDARQSDVIQYGDGTGPLDTHGHTMAVAFDETQITHPENRCNPPHPIPARGRPPTLAFAIRGRDGTPQAELGDDKANAILTPNGGRGGIGVGAVFADPSVRRLTPRECERLQGFPDDYTLIEYRNKPAADGPRYKALGNSMAVPVMCWIGERIKLVQNSGT